MLRSHPGSCNGAVSIPSYLEIRTPTYNRILRTSTFRRSFAKGNRRGRFAFVHVPQELQHPISFSASAIHTVGKELPSLNMVSLIRCPIPQHQVTAVLYYYGRSIDGVV